MSKISRALPILVLAIFVLSMFPLMPAFAAIAITSLKDIDGDPVRARATLFPASTDLFGAYGIGLSVGFFGYFVFIIILVKKSDNFDKDYFLDGRRKIPGGKWYFPEYADQARPPVAASKKDDDIKE